MLPIQVTAAIPGHVRRRGSAASRLPSCDIVEHAVRRRQLASLTDNSTRKSIHEGARSIHWARAFVAGLLVVVPIYLSVLLLLKAMQSVAGLARPFAMLLPESLPAERALSLPLVLLVCFRVGVAVRGPAGRAIPERIEKSFFERMPGYAVVRSLSQRPTPFAGAVYILNRERVHPLDTPFTQAFKSVSRWGSGSKDPVAAMRTNR